MAFPKKISELPASGLLKNTDLFVTVNNDITSKTTLAQLISTLSGSVDTNTFLTGGTLNGDVLTLTLNDNVNINISGFSNQFTGNTPDTCIDLLYVDVMSGCTSSGITIPTNVTIGDGGDTGNNGNLIVNEKIWLTDDGTTHSPAIYWGSNNDNFEISRPGAGLEMQVFGIKFSEGNLSNIQSMDVWYDVTISGDTKLGGDLDLCDGGTLYVDSISGCSPINVYSEMIVKGGIVIDASDADTTIKIPEFICTNCVDDNDVFYTTQNLQEYVGKTVQFEHTGEKCWNVTKQVGLTVTNSWNTEPDGCEQCSGEEGSNNHYVLCEGQEGCEPTEIITEPDNVLIENGAFNYNCCWYSVNPPTSTPTSEIQPTIEDIFPLSVEDCAEAVETYTSFLITPCPGTVGVDRWITCYEGISPNDVIKIEEDEIGCYIVVKPATTIPDSNFVSVVDGGCVDDTCPGGPPVENHAYDPCNEECADALGLEIPLISSTKLNLPGAESIFFMYKCCWFQSIGTTPEGTNIEVESPETEIFAVAGIEDCPTTDLYIALEWEDCNEEGSYRYTACNPNITKTMVTNEMINDEDGEPVEGCWKCVGVSNNEIDSQVPDEFEPLTCETCEDGSNQLNLKLIQEPGTPNWTVTLTSNIGDTGIAAFQFTIGDEGIEFEEAERGEIVPPSWDFTFAGNSNICFNLAAEEFTINEEVIIATWVLNTEDIITSLSLVTVSNGGGEEYSVGVTIV